MPADDQESTKRTLTEGSDDAPSNAGSSEGGPTETLSDAGSGSESKRPSDETDPDAKRRKDGAEDGSKGKGDDETEDGDKGDIKQEKSTGNGDNGDDKMDTDVKQEDEGEGDGDKASNEEPSAPLTSLQRAQLAAEKARILMLPELDPPKLPAPGSGLPKHQHKYSLSAIRAIKRLKDALPFIAPVDPIRQGVPQYFDYIKHPMDLGTMEKKLMNNEYDSIKQLVDDFNLIVSNCIVFNGEEALISKMGLNIAQSFKKQLSNMPTFDSTKKGSQAAAAAAATASVSGNAAGAGASGHAGGADSVDSHAVIDDGHDHVGKRSSTTTTVLGPNGVPTIRRKSTIDGRPKREIRPPRAHSGGYVGHGTGEGRPRNKKYASELQFCAQLLREMQSRKMETITFPFLVPVDPVEQGIPTYFDVIKEPMDLGTMQKKLNEGIYYTGDEFEADFRLMLRNCYTFNPEGTPVNVLGHKVEEYFNNRWIDKPIPGMHMNEDSDASDVDEEYAEAGMVNPAIDVLEEQLRMIRKQLKKLKKDALADFYKRGHRRTLAVKRRQPSHSASAERSHSNGHGGSSSHGHGSGSGSGSASGSGSGGSSRAMPTEMTYEMKRELRDKIDKLPERKIRTVLAIIQESMPDLGNNGQDEIELEVDALDTQTLLRLYAYAVMGKKEGEIADDEMRKKKARPLSEEEHSRKIAEIESKLKEFDQVAGKSPSSLNAPQPPPEMDSSSDEEQLSDSSSEEE